MSKKKKKKWDENNESALASMRHPKTGPTVAWVPVGVGKMKVNGVWVESCTFINPKTKDSFTKATDDFKSFTSPKLKG